MAHPYVRNHLHLVFSTKERRSFIKPAVRDELYSYIRRVGTDYGISIDLIGGTEDHVHLLLDLPPKIALSNLVCALKAKSSKWMNEHGHIFGWQNSYGCFSVSVSSLRQVKEYIAHQEEHHRRRDFLGEFNAMLQRDGIRTKAEMMFAPYDKASAEQA
jgi:putative transposase